MSDKRDKTENKTKKPSLYIRTFGCQMNVRDSEIICGLLIKDGYKLVDDQREAGIIIFNTCSVRQHAEDKIWSQIGRYKGNKVIGIVGCIAQNYKEKIFEIAPNVDFVVGPGDIHKIPGIVKKLSVQRSGLLECKIWETDSLVRPEEVYRTGFYQDKEHAYVVISEGCSNFCSYCVVPYVRGELHNRDYKEISKEIKTAIDKGITKITLLGQNVNAYKFSDDGSDSIIGFIELLKKVNAIQGLREFSFVTSHPRDTSMDLFKAMEGLDKLKKCLHLPVQSGSDRILKLMNRGYTIRFYLDLIDNYRKALKGASLTTDIIVGFPGETEEDFLGTYNLVKDAQFDAAYIFKYSPRPHTQAQKFSDDVDMKEKERRHKLILDLQKDISNKKKCLKK